MSKRQADLFAALEPPPAEPPPPDPAWIESRRGWLHERLEFFKAASSWQWPPDSRDPWHTRYEFLAATRLLPPDEGAPLWAEFEAEFERLSDLEAIEHERKVGHLPLPDWAGSYAEQLLRNRPDKKLPPWARLIPEYAHLAVKMPDDYDPSGPPNVT